MTPSRLILVLSVTALAAVGCKKALDIRHNQAYIIGDTADIHPVDRETEAKIDPDVLRGSVLIATHLASNRVKFCSGTLIAGESGAETLRVLSNHHCFAQTDADDKALPDLMPEACTATSAYFGFIKGQTQEAQPIACKPGSLRTNFDGDLSVFSLAANPPDKYKPLALWDGDEAAAGREALIIHYPDVDGEMAEPPRGGAKLPTAEATLNDCKVIGLFAVGEWDLDRTLPYSLRHTCDLIHGSSGSGLIDVKTGKLLGVNWGGIKISLDAGVRTDNVATRAKFAQAFLNNTVEDEIKLASERRGSADALAARQGEGGAIKSKSETVAEAVRAKCGVAGAAGGVASLALLILGFCAPLAFAATAAAPAAPASAATPPSAPTAWAVSYLLNSAFLAEFDAIAANAAEPDRQALRLRAAFALASAKAKAQYLPHGASEALLAGLKAPEADAVGASLGAALAPHWQRFSAFYAQTSPSCPLDVAEVKDFAARQKALLAGDRGLNPQALLKPVVAWDLPKVQCLVFALMASTPEAKAKEGYDPIHLLTALQQTGSPLMKDDALRAMAALRRLQLGQYAETLRTIMELSDGEPAYRLAYDLVQRVFSARQRGEGAVALQGL